MENQMTHIYVDADACPVVKQIEIVAKSHNIPVTLLCDTNHVLKSDYSEVKIIGAGADAVDFALVNSCRAGDIVVTQDYGVAALALGKKAYAIHQNGWQYTNENIDRLLMKRHISKRARRANKKVHIKGPAKRTEDDDAMFVNGLTSLIRTVGDIDV
jgi:hypothetical protein